MNEQLTITLDREDWIVIANFVSREIGREVDIMPIVRMLDALMDEDKGFAKTLKIMGGK